MTPPRSQSPSQQAAAHQRLWQAFEPPIGSMPLRTQTMQKQVKFVHPGIRTRAFRFAFEYATRQGRPRVTVVHNMSTLPRSDGLFVEVAQRVARDYPAIQTDVMWAGRACNELLRDASAFSVILTPNLYGVYLGAILSGLVGTLPPLIASKLE